MRTTSVIDCYTNVDSKTFDLSPSGVNLGRLHGTSNQVLTTLIALASQAERVVFGRRTWIDYNSFAGKHQREM